MSQATKYLKNLDLSNVTDLEQLVLDTYNAAQNQIMGIKCLKRCEAQCKSCSSSEAKEIANTDPLPFISAKVIRDEETKARIKAFQNLQRENNRIAGIRETILSYCQGINHLEFDESDLDEMVMKISVK